MRISDWSSDVCSSDLFWLLTLHPTASGRVYAGDGGVYVTVAIGWLWAVDAVRPTRWDLLGALLCLCGMAVIMSSPRPLWPEDCRGPLRQLPRVLPLLPERTRQPHLATAAFCWQLRRAGAGGGGDRDGQRMVAARRARVRLRFRLGGTPLLREEPAGDVQASGLFVHRGLDDVPGHPHRPRSLLIGTAGIRSRVETHRRTRRSGLRPRRSIDPLPVRLDRKSTRLNSSH